MCFTNGVYFNFTGSAVTSLAPGQIVLVVHNQSAFTARYGSGFNIAGQYTGALNNGGETLRLEDAVGEKILDSPTTTPGTPSPTALASRWSSSTKTRRGTPGA